MRSKASMQFRTCAGKKMFLTDQEACYVAALRSREEGFTIYRYHCRTCRGYHLTKHEPESVQRLREEMSLHRRAAAVEAKINAGNIVLAWLHAVLA